VVEDDEHFSIVLIDVDGAAPGDPGIVTLLNDDEEQPDLLELSVDDTEVLEGNRRDTRAGVTITLSAPAPQAVTFTLSTVDGSAVAGDDYYGTNRTIAVGAGATSVTVHLRVIADTIPEPDELFTVEVSNVTGATIRDGVGEVIILNDD
jgi:hypothetical protein